MIRRKATILVTIIGAVLIAGLALWAWAGAQPLSPGQRQARARELLSSVHVSAIVLSASLTATSAFADFGVESGVRLVRVRIVNDLHLTLRIEAAQRLSLAEPLQICLVGPDSAPDDAGLTNPCWGEPDLGELVAAQLATDDVGHPFVGAHRAIVVNAALRRGQTRCDYPPGQWHLQVAANPVIDGSALGPTDLTGVVELPWKTTTALPLLRTDQTRYCGLATAVYLQQGGPPVSSP